MARLIMGMETRRMLQNAMELVTPTITEAMAKLPTRNTVEEELTLRKQGT